MVDVQIVTVGTQGPVGPAGPAGPAGGDLWSDPVDANIIPDVDSSRDLGSTGVRFASTFTDNATVTIDITLGGVVIYTDGVRQTFNPDNTIAGLNFGSNGAEPSSPAVGDVFYDTAAGQFKGYNGAWINLGAGANGGDAWGDVVDANIIPDVDGTRDLGATLTRFDETFTDNLDVTSNIVVGGTVDGRNLATDGSKLDGIESGATADQTDAEIKTAYENNANTNAFTDAEQTKLSDIEALADVTDEGNVIPALNGATITAATVATGDKILGQDLNDADNLKTYTAQSIADLKVTELSEDTTPVLGGSLATNGNNITDVHELQVDATPDTDHTANGFTTNTINAGVVTAIGELVYLATDGEWALADADAEATASGMLAVSMAVGSDGNPLLVALAGSFVRDDTFAFTIGEVLYADTTAGGITATAPSGTGDIVRVIGYAVTADIVYFNPGGTWVEIV